MFNLKFSDVTFVPTKNGWFNFFCVKELDKEHLVVYSKNLDVDNVNLRIHSECITSEVFGSLKCDCSEQLSIALDHIHEHGGVVIYLRQEGRGIGLFNKINAYKAQEHGLDTIQANLAINCEVDSREYNVVKAILDKINIKNVNLLTNNPDKIEFVKKMGIKINKIVPVRVKPNKHSLDYLNTKKNKLDHLL